jgi:hypothetical protein
MPDIRASHPPAAFQAPVFWLLLGATGALGLILHRALATLFQDGLIAAIVMLVIVLPLSSFCGRSRRGA